MNYSHSAISIKYYFKIFSFGKERRKLLSECENMLLGPGIFYLYLRLIWYKTNDFRCS